MANRYFRSSIGKLHTFLVTYGVGIVCLMAFWEYGTLRKTTWIFGIFAWLPGLIFFLKAKFSVLKHGHPFLSHPKVMDKENAVFRILGIILMLAGVLLTWKVDSYIFRD